MSLEQAKALIERMKTDKAFADEVNAIETSEARLGHIKESGFDCSAEDIREAGNELNVTHIDPNKSGQRYCSCNDIPVGYFVCW